MSGANGMIEPIKEGHTISDSLKQWLADEFNRVRKKVLMKFILTKKPMKKQMKKLKAKP